jgi:hypothetical protein
MHAAQFEVPLAQNLASNYNIQESQMHKLLTSVALCLLAQTAAAQCVATTVSAPPLAQPRQGGELIKSAAAGTHDAPAIRTVSAPAAATPGAAGGEEPPRRTGSAMLLAAVAVMSAIALRRGTSDR